MNSPASRPERLLIVDDEPANLKLLDRMLRSQGYHRLDLVGDPRQGWAVLAAMTAIFVVAVVVVISQEQQGNPLLAALGADQGASATQSGGNMEGKEARFGIAATALFAAITTAASCGAVIGQPVWHG